MLLRKKPTFKRLAAAEPNEAPLGKKAKESCEGTVADASSTSASSTTKQYAYCSWCKQMWSLADDYPYEGNLLMSSCPRCEDANQ
eukprot:12399673-Karenia_brevis.AAC.1